MVEITAISATDALITEAFALRHEMFVIEQGVPQELEVDDDDKIAAHLVAFSQGRVVGTLRIVLHGCTAKIGRMAVSTSLRKNSIGRGVSSLPSQHRAVGNHSHAQVSARDFYARIGYTQEGPLFDDAGNPARGDAKESGRTSRITDFCLELVPWNTSNERRKLMSQHAPPCHSNLTTGALSRVVPKEKRSRRGQADRIWSR